MRVRSGWGWFSWGCSDLLVGVFFGFYVFVFGCEGVSSDVSVFDEVGSAGFAEVFVSVFEELLVCEDGEWVVGDVYFV